MSVAAASAVARGPRPPRLQLGRAPRNPDRRLLALVAPEAPSPASVDPGREPALGRLRRPRRAAAAEAGLTLAFTSGTVKPAEARKNGAATVFFDLNFNNRVGTPTVPADPALIRERADRLFDFAVSVSGCRRRGSR